MEGEKRGPGGAESLGPAPDEPAAGALVLAVGQCDFWRACNGLLKMCEFRTGDLGSSAGQCTEL